MEGKLKKPNGKKRERMLFILKTENKDVVEMGLKPFEVPFFNYWVDHQ